MRNPFDKLDTLSVAVIIIITLLAFSVGALLYLFEMATAVAGELYNVDAFNQPGVELSKQATYALMGRPGFEELAGRID